MSGGCFIGEVPGYFEGWYSGNVSHYLPGCGGVILVDNADRDILHLSAAENGCHEEQAEQGQHETYPEIYKVISMITYINHLWSIALTFLGAILLLFG